MKTPILTALAVSYSLSVFAQGSILFYNHVVGRTISHVYAPLSANPFVSQIGNGSNDYPAGTTSWNGFTLIGATATGRYSGSATLAALLVAPGFNAAESSLVPAANIPNIVSFQTGSFAGFVINGVNSYAYNVGPPGDATVEMVAWDNSSGLYSTWELASAAWENSFIFAGKSQAWNTTLGGFGVPPGIPPFLEAQSFNLYLIPEQSTGALAGLGTAALLVFRRRK
jgi:hypothetical protein